MFLSIAGIVLVGALISYWEVSRLWKQKMKKEIGFYSTLMVFALGLAIAKEVHAKIPNPLDWLIVLYQPLSNWLFSLLT